METFPNPVQTEPSAITEWTDALRSAVDTEARNAGFARTGIAALDDPASPQESAGAARFAQWVEAGRAGEMHYLTRRNEHGALVRSSIRYSLPWARSVLVCAFPYASDLPLSIDAPPPGSAWIARYAWSGKRDAAGSLAPSDYHDELLARLRRVESALTQHAGCQAKSYVDTGPLMERSLAARAGIGWIGRNTCVIHPELGSWLLLAAIVTSLELPTAQAALAAPDRCGSCTRCIEACPTGALLSSAAPGAAREMDATRCIAYLTIEAKGSIDPALREPVGRHVFGCDICQDVCPWNSRAKRAGKASAATGMEPRTELVNPALEWLASLDSAGFKRQFRGSPLERTGRRRLRRNLAIAMGNSLDPCHLPTLDEWAGKPRMHGSQQPPDDPVLRETANWAADRIRWQSEGR
jgi:epoxyqueuosine reductase